MGGKVIKALRASPWLAPLTEAELQALATCGRVYDYEPAQVIIQADGDDLHLFIPRKGRGELRLRMWTEGGQCGGEAGPELASIGKAFGWATRARADRHRRSPPDANDPPRGRTTLTDARHARVPPSLSDEGDIVAFAEPDTLLIDEVLAVGDTRFQYKRYEHVRSLSDCGTTIVFVSHDLFAVERLCDTVLWLDQGRVQAYGSPCDVISAYLQSIDRRKLPDSDLTKSQGRFLRIQSVKTMDESGANVTEVRPGERLTVEVAYSAERCLGQARFALGVSTGRAGRLFYPSMLLDGRSMPVREGWATIKCHVECLPPMPGSYEIWGEVWDETGRVNLSPWALWSGFRVVDDLSALSQIASSRTASHSHDALVFVPYKWEYRACPKRLLNQKSR